MATNSNLHMSKAGKQDEFYTPKELIEKELKHYRQHFKGKVVFCNCDDPYESEFFKYFAANFNFLGLKKLITTCYVSSPIMYTQLSLFDDMEYSVPVSSNPKKKPYKVEITEVEDLTGNGATDLDDVQLLLKNKKNVCTILKGDGDFRSEECRKFLDEADIIVTNPPFSLSKEYIPMMMNSGKKFIALGNLNHSTFKEIFHYIYDHQLFVGYNSGHFWFKVPADYEEKNTDYKQDETGQKWRRMGNICWYTNFDIDVRHQPLILYKNYSPDIYEHYDNYDAIHIEKVEDIPCDYYGIMAVPITYLASHCEEQFEILGKFDGGTADNPLDLAKPILHGKAKYKRIAIRRREQPL